MPVSLIIPTHDRAAMVGTAVESALSQTHHSVGIVVVDDGSTDNTVAELMRFGSAVKVVSQENAGPSAARNRGAQESKGEIIAFLDSDDVWLPGKISRQVEVLEKGGCRMCCCVCKAMVKGPAGEVVGTSFDITGLGLPLAEGDWMSFRVGGFNPRLRILKDFGMAMKPAGIGSRGASATRSQ